MTRPGDDILLRVLSGGSAQPGDAVRLAPCGIKQAPDSITLVVVEGGSAQPGNAITLFPCMQGGGAGPGEPVDPEPPPPDLPPQRIGMDAGVGSLWARVTGQQSASRPIRYLHPPLRPVHSGARWQRGKLKPHQTDARWGQKPPRPRRHASPWPQELRDASRDHDSPWGILNRRRTHRDAPWQPVERRVPASVDAHHATPPPKRIHIHDAWAPVPRWLAPRLDAGYTYPPHRWERWIVPWGEVRGIDNLIRPPIPDEPDPEEPDDPYYYPPLGDAVLLNLQCGLHHYPGGAVRMWFTDAPCPPVPYTPRRTIFVTHSVIITRTEDGQRIPMQGITLSTDMDSWTWDARGTPLGATALAHLQHTAQGPRELNVEIDGIDWRILAEDTSDEERWGRRSRSLQGRGIAAHLAAPYATPASGAPDNDRTAQQIAADLLEFTGWTLDWQTVDWLVPGGAYSYQDQTPIGLISQVAAAVGAFAQAHRQAQTIRVRPRYPISPWQWAEATPDAIIPGSLVKRRAASWDERPAYNRAWVAGRTGGVLVGTTRTGTAGDRAAPQVVDPLITHVDAGRERGRIILATAGRASRVALDTPLLPPPDGPGLILPGHLVEVQEYSGTWRGLAKAVTITATKASVTQSLEIERRFP